jgi:hypothetical protein
MSPGGKRMLIKEILQGLQESSVAHPEMTDDDRTRSLQMQSFLKHLEIQMDDEDGDRGAHDGRLDALQLEQDQIKSFML